MHLLTLLLAFPFMFATPAFCQEWTTGEENTSDSLEELLEESEGLFSDQHVITEKEDAGGTLEALEKTQEKLDLLEKEANELKLYLESLPKSKKVLINGWDVRGLFTLRIFLNRRDDQSKKGSFQIRQGFKSINGFYSRNLSSLRFRQYLCKGKNTFVFTFPKPLVENNADKTFSVKILTGRIIAKEYLVLFKTETKQYSLTLEINEMSVEPSWHKAKSWSFLPPAEVSTIRDIIKEYHSAFLSNNIDAFFAFKNKYERLAMRDCSLLEGYPANHIKWDNFRDLYVPEYINHAESELNPNIEICLSPENTKVVVVRTTDGKPIFTLFTKNQAGKVTHAYGENYFLNFIYIDGHWEIY